MHLLKIFISIEGMRDSGGHGGSSHAERNVPIVFIGPSCHQSNDSFNQIDISPTLSVLFGLPIPASSIGALIPDFLTELSMEQKLYAYFYNGKRLLDKIVKFYGIEIVKDKGKQCLTRIHTQM